MCDWPLDPCCRPSRFAEFVNGVGSIQNFRNKCCVEPPRCCIQPCAEPCPTPCLPPPPPNRELIILRDKKPRRRCCPDLKFDDRPGWPFNSSSKMPPFEEDLCLLSDDGSSEEDDCPKSMGNVVRTKPEKNVTVVQLPPQQAPSPIPYPMPMPYPVISGCPPCNPYGMMCGSCPIVQPPPQCLPCNNPCMQYPSCNPGSYQGITNPFGMNMGGMGCFGGPGASQVIPMCIPTCAQYDGSRRRKHRRRRREVYEEDGNTLGGGVQTFSASAKSKTTSSSSKSGGSSSKSGTESGSSSSSSSSSSSGSDPSAETKDNEEAEEEDIEIEVSQG